MSFHDSRCIRMVPSKVALNCNQPMWSHSASQPASQPANERVSPSQLHFLRDCFTHFFPFIVIIPLIPIAHSPMHFDCCPLFNSFVSLSQYLAHYFSSIPSSAIHTYLSICQRVWTSHSTLLNSTSQPAIGNDKRFGLRDLWSNMAMQFQNGLLMSTHSNQWSI